MVKKEEKREKISLQGKDKLMRRETGKVMLKKRRFLRVLRAGSQEEALRKERMKR